MSRLRELYAAALPKAPTVDRRSALVNGAERVTIHQHTRPVFGRISRYALASGYPLLSNSL